MQKWRKHERSNLASTNTIGDGVQELKIDYGPGYRIYFGHGSETLVVLLGGATRAARQETFRTQKSVRGLIGRRREMPTLDYRQRLLEDLTDSEYAAGYLTAALEEGEVVFSPGNPRSG